MKDLAAHDETQRHGDASLDDRFRRLKLTIWITKGARYNAAKRLERQAEMADIAATGLSFAVTSLSLLSLLFADGISPFQSKTIGAATIIISFFIMLMSLMQSGKRYGLRAYVLHRCGEELTDLYREVEAAEDLDQMTADAYLSFLKRYNSVLAHNNENHTNTDYNYFQTQNPHKFYKYFEMHSMAERIMHRFIYQAQPYLSVFLYVAFPMLMFMAAMAALFPEAFGVAHLAPNGAAAAGLSAPWP